MKGFLSKFLLNNKGDQKPIEQPRQEPTLTARSKDDLTEVNEDLHPDEIFIDYEVKNLSDTSNAHQRDSEQSPNLQATADVVTEITEKANFGHDLQDEIEHDASTFPTDVDDSHFEPSKGFNSSSEHEDDSKNSIGAEGNISQTKIEKSPNKIWQILVETKKCPKQFWGHRYDPNAIDADGNTLLHYAARANNKTYSLHLLGLGWNILARNNDGLTPLDVAEIEKNIDLVDTLKRLYKSYLSEHIDSDATVEGPSYEVTLSRAELKRNPTEIYDQSPKSYEASADAISEVSSDALETQNNEKIIELLPHEGETQSKQTTKACVKCGASFADFNAVIKLWFCPFCGAEQTDDKPLADTIENPVGEVDSETVFSKHTSADHQFNSSSEMSKGEELYEFTIEDYIADPAPQETGQTHTSQSIPKSLVEERYDGVDEGLDDELIDVDRQIYQPVSSRSISSLQSHGSLGDWEQDRYEPTQMEDWEIFLDEDLEEQSHPSDQYFDDEDPLELGRIVEYASRLTSRINYYHSRDRRRIYAFFISVLGDFPFYQSYAAIERLIARDVQIDQIQDAYFVKRVWMTNPNIWSSRRYNRMENAWSVSRNSKLKNSMSWQLASDLANFHTPNELENLILNDWYVEWLNLSLNGGDTASGLDPAYSLYPTYLYEKRRLLIAKLNIG